GDPNAYGPITPSVARASRTSTRRALDASPSRANATAMRDDVTISPNGARHRRPPTFIDAPTSGAWHLRLRTWDRRCPPVGWSAGMSTTEQASETPSDTPPFRYTAALAQDIEIRW